MLLEFIPKVNTEEKRKIQPWAELLICGSLSGFSFIIKYLNSNQIPQSPSKHDILFRFQKLSTTEAFWRGNAAPSSLGPSRLQLFLCFYLKRAELGRAHCEQCWSSDNAIKDLPDFLIFSLNNLVHGHLGQLIRSWKVILKCLTSIQYSAG